MMTDTLPTRDEAVVIARAAGVDPQSWALATVDEGITYLGRTRRECFIEAGICTKYKRSSSGKYGAIYRYESEGGTVAFVADVASLLAEGFRLNLP
jgi:hypothetical protein